MSDSLKIEQVNRDLARQINDEAIRDPDSPYAGKFVGIANGRVVVIADNLDDVASKLDQCEPDSTRTFCIEAGIDYDRAAEIWKVG